MSNFTLQPDTIELTGDQVLVLDSLGDVVVFIALFGEVDIYSAYAAFRFSNAVSTEYIPLL